MAYHTKVYRKQGGYELIVASGGTLDVESGGALKIAGVQVTASATELNLTDKAVQNVTADGPITVKNGVAWLAKDPAGVVAATLADPTAGTDDFKVLTIIAGTAHAHTVTCASGFGGAGAGEDVATFSGVVGDTLTVMAYGGKWYVIGMHQVTIA